MTQAQAEPMFSDFQHTFEPLFPGMQDPDNFDDSVLRYVLGQLLSV